MSLLNLFRKPRRQTVELVGNRLRVHEAGKAVRTAVSKNGSVVASSTKDGRFIVWRPPSMQPVENLAVALTDISCLAVSNDGKRVALAGVHASEGWLLNLADLQAKSNALCRIHKRQISAVDFSPSGDTVATGGWDWAVKISDVRTLDVYLGNSHPDILSDVRFSPDGGLLVSASWDWTVKVWDVNRRQLLRSWESDPDNYQVRLSPDASWMAVAKERHFMLYDLKTGLMMVDWEGRGSLLDVSDSAAGPVVWESGAENIVRGYSAAKKSYLYELKGHSAPVISVSSSADGGTLASGGVDGAVGIWRLRH